MFKPALIAIAVAVVLSGCSGSTPLGQSSLPASDPVAAVAQPNGAEDYYFGENAHGLPGGIFPCLPPSGTITQCTLVINIAIPPNPLAHLPASLVSGLHPSDLASAYNLQTQSGGGTIAIVDAYDDPLAELEMATYRAVFGLPACLSLTGCFRKVNQLGRAGPYPRLDLGWAQEIALDLEVTSAVCPRCKIILVEANSASVDDLGAAVDRAATFSPIAISNSYYAPEWSGEQANDAHFNHPGIAITASGGDHHSPSYPAASPYVTAVGGTTLTGSPGHWSETPWLYGGGGCSAYVRKPSWQSGSTCTSRRAVDIAAVADANTGVSAFSLFAGGWVVAGGTSVGAPLVASAYALAGRGDSPGYSYARAWAFRSIPPSLKTGLGSPIGLGGF
ncbi:MAG: peptidase S8 [Candidatus Eremiobacteraeota bacterium]|nr:peptidase S8 [Candidatus Eremiobacteraeota bacterium]